MWFIWRLKWKIVILLITVLIIMIKFHKCLVLCTISHNTAYAVCLQNISLYGIIIFPWILLSRYECRLSFSDFFNNHFHCTLQYIKTIKPTGYTLSMCVYISSFDTVSSSKMLTCIDFEICRMCSKNSWWWLFRSRHIGWIVNE